MAKWFQTRKEDLPESIRELSPEDLDKVVKDKAAADAKAAALETEVNSLKTAAATQATEFETVKKNLAALESRGNGNEDEDEADKNKNKNKGPASVFVNEDEAFRTRLGPLEAAVAGSGALTARLTAREAVSNSKDGRIEMKIWDKYANEINTLMQKEQAASQINPNSWVNAFVYVKGLHFSDLQDAAIKKTDIFAETGHSSGTLPEDDAGSKDKLSTQELEIAKKFNMTPEKYLERKKGMKFSAVA